MAEAITLKNGPFTATVTQGSALVGDTTWAVEFHWFGKFATGFATYEAAAEYAYRAINAAYEAAVEAFMVVPLVEKAKV